MMTQADKGRLFRSLHEQDDPFILANSWDAGSTRLLAGTGHVAIGTTSAGYAFSLGQLDNKTGRDAILENASIIANATDLPVSADLENGFGDSPESVAATISLAGEAGLVGGSIEDSTYDTGAPLYDLAHSVDRVSAAVEAARNLSFDFTLTARAENFLVGRPNLDEAIKRIQAYQVAGADVLYVPGLVNADDIRTVAESVDRPINVVAGLSPNMPDLATLGDLGAKRISIGSAFARLAYGEVVKAAKDMLDSGKFTSLHNATTYRTISERLS
jgi:2-methylisocitrate lyase-like PEP mutase family enzyme